MNKIRPAAEWPESWKYSYEYDRQEIYGEIRYFGYAYAYANRRQRTIRLITDALEPGARILDVAGAQGNFSLSLAELGYKVVWNDLRRDLADYVRLKYERGNIDFAPGNVFHLGFGAEFDCVLITEIIEHVAHPDEFLKKISAMVRPGGIVVMSTPNGAYFRNRLPRFSACPDPSVFESVQFKPNSDGHIFLLWPDEIRSLGGDAGMAIETHDVFTTPLTCGHFKSEKLLRIVPRKFVFFCELTAARLPFAMRSRLMLQSATRFRKPSL